MTQAQVCDTCPRPCVGSPSCKLASGCTGSRECNDGIWGPCSLDGSSTKTCTVTCGSAGTQACYMDGSLGTCNATTCCANKGAACFTGNNCGGTVDCNGNCAFSPWSSTPACTSTLGFPGHYACNLTGQNLGCRPDNPQQRYEICNGLDDDGDGVIDNDVGSMIPYSWHQSCSASGPGCTLPGTQTCNRGVPSACVANTTCTTAACAPYGYSGRPACFNGQWFCDHSANTGITAPTCTTLSCGTAGTIKCWGPGARGACQAPETCNGCDDDGDGVLDNEPGSTVPYSKQFGCTNRCGDPHTVTCGNPTCPERPEICNGLDDNCDGQIDEGDVCRQTGGACTP